MPTKAQIEQAKDVFRIPNPKDVSWLAERRYAVKDILNTNLLAPESRAAYEQHYAELGRLLEAAATKAAS